MGVDMVVCVSDTISVCNSGYPREAICASDTIRVVNVICVDNIILVNIVCASNAICLGDKSRTKTSAINGAAKGTKDNTETVTTTRTIVTKLSFSTHFSAINSITIFSCDINDGPLSSEIAYECDLESLEFSCHLNNIVNFVFGLRIP